MFRVILDSRERGGLNTKSRVVRKGGEWKKGAGVNGGTARS